MFVYGFSATRGLSLLACAGLLSGCVVRAHCSGFSCGAWARERWLWSCGAWARLSRGSWDPPGPRIPQGLLHWPADSQPLSPQGGPAALCRCGECLLVFLLVPSPPTGSLSAQIRCTSGPRASSRSFRTCRRTWPWWSRSPSSSARCTAPTRYPAPAPLARCPACPGLGAPQQCRVTPLWLLGARCVWSVVWAEALVPADQGPAGGIFFLFPVQSLVCPAAPSQASSQAGRLCPFRRRGAGGSEPRPGPRGVAERANPRSSPLGGPPLPWSRRGWLRGTASCVLTSLAPCALESQHDGGSGLVSGPAAAHAGEGGGDPLSQQVPPAAPASGEARQVRGGARRASVRPACGWAGRGGGGRGLCRRSVWHRADAPGRMDE